MPVKTPPPADKRPLTDKIKILFISGSVGLGHVTRDLAIAGELRKQCPHAEISWLAGDPARTALRNAGEIIMPEGEQYNGGTDLAEKLSGLFKLNITNPLPVFFNPRILREEIKFLKVMRQNIKLFKTVTNRERFHLVIADEAIDIAFALGRKPFLKTAPFTWIVDYLGFDGVSRNPLEKLCVYLLNSESR